MFERWSGGRRRKREGREGKGKRCALLPELHPPHLDEVLRDLGHPLLALVDREARPVNEFLVNLVKRTGKQTGLMRRAAMHTLVQAPSCSCPTT